MANPTQASPPLSRREGISRRDCGIAMGATALLAPFLSMVSDSAARAESESSESAAFSLRYLLSSAMYGYTSLSEIMPEVQKIGASGIDIWPKVHGNQREQVDEMGEQAFRELLDSHDVSLHCITQYSLGPFRLQNEMRFAQRFGCHTMVTGASGPKGLAGSELKSAVAKFVEAMKPHLAVAEETEVTIAIENHSNSLIESPDSLKWLAEMLPSKHLSIAFAPYHLEQDSEQMATLIRELGNSISMFYAWQHGKGCHVKLPKEEELLQMPGRGELEFAPILAALKAIKYQGWTEVFMHPVPRGVPILESTAEVTNEINRGRRYLDERV